MVLSTSLMLEVSSWELLARAGSCAQAWRCLPALPCRRWGTCGEALKPGGSMGRYLDRVGAEDRRA